MVSWIQNSIIFSIWILSCTCQDFSDQLFSTQFSGEIIDLSATSSPLSRLNEIDWRNVPIDNPFADIETYDMTWKKIFAVDSSYEDSYLILRDPFVGRWSVINIEVPPQFAEGRAIFNPLMRRLQRFRGGVRRAVKPQLPRSAARTQLKLQKFAAGNCC